MKFSNRSFLLLIVSLLALGNAKYFAYAEDQVDDEIVEDEVVVDGSESDVEEVEETDEGGTDSRGSPDADTVILFVKPTGDGTELPAGKLVEFFVGFTNNGDEDFVLDSLDASFRYPMDFNFYIQNFTEIQYSRVVKPHQEATLQYSFYPAEAFAGRPLGLSINLAYHNANGEEYFEAVYNQTVNINEVYEGLDGETFFLYVFLLALAVLALLAGHHFLSAFGKKKVQVKKSTVEMGTTTKNGIDYDWIPKEYLAEFQAKQKLAIKPNSPKQKQASKPNSPKSKPSSPATRQTLRSRVTKEGSKSPTKVR